MGRSQARFERAGRWEDTQRFKWPWRCKNHENLGDLFVDAIKRLDEAAAYVEIHPEAIERFKHPKLIDSGRDTRAYG